MPYFSSRSKLPHAPGNFPPAARSGSIPEECQVPGALLGAQSSSPAGTSGTQRGRKAPGRRRAPLPLQPNIPAWILAQFSPKLRILKELQLCQVFPATSCPLTLGGSSEPLVTTLSPKAFSRGCSGGTFPPSRAVLCHSQPSLPGIPFPRELELKIPGAEEAPGPCRMWGLSCSGSSLPAAPGPGGQSGMCRAGTPIPRDVPRSQRGWEAPAEP